MESIPIWFFLMSTGLFGLLFGSLANVIIWRVPRGESIVSPGSHCPGCGTPIRWYDNIPVASWVILGARCRECGGRISARYPIVEATSGLLWLAAAARWGMSARTLFGIGLFYLLLILTLIDLDHMRLPNAIVAALGVVGVVGVLFAQLTGVPAVPLFIGRGLLSAPMPYAASGIVIGGGISAAIAGAYALIRKSAGLGMGDIKLLAVLGLFFGPYVLMVLMVASILGAVVGVAVLRRHKGAGQARVPFGPFLASGALLVALWGPVVLDWYLRLAGVR
ncbi:MAG: prepilin peptidase [Actinobacteria bacterium HGW-Actinobacteria-1]|nr:MAG: prepilin peptidase [Actinobacteria bacterium HGW-Actinobacteria-1]